MAEASRESKAAAMHRKAESSRVLSLAEIKSIIPAVELINH
jgi:hypothetical protein